ncbi:MAG: hypothetical protein JWO80_3288 [Bryobacterales bacterium]|nr:hypothetical protein [Bryobacterales bacterium]
MNQYRLAVVLVAGLVLLASPANLNSCGPFLPQAIFTAPHGPVEPEAEFAHGKLGVILGGFRTTHLVVAYRYLSGLDLNESEIRTVYPGPRESSVSGPNSAYVPTDPLSRWIFGRNRVSKLPQDPPIYPYKNLMHNGEYIGFQNCLDGAFEKAADTLAARTALWSGESEELKDWVRGQDEVFANCGDISGGVKAARIPAAAPADAPPLLRADRAYQIAAAYFYAGEWNQSREQLADIRSGADSPWRPYADYLIARSYIREALVDGKPGALETARARLIEIESDPEQRALHQSSARLVQFIDTRLFPEQRFQTLNTTLTKPRLGQDAKQTLTDFLFLNQKRTQSLGSGTVWASDLADWISSWRFTEAVTGVDPIARWRNSGTVAWLVAALRSAKPTSTAGPELLLAAQAIKPDSPAFLSLAYYASALESARGNRDKARMWDEDALRVRMNVSDRNLFFAQRMALSRNWGEFLRYAPRALELAGYDPDDVYPFSPRDLGLRYANRGSAFDDDATKLCNTKIPLNLWIEAARVPGLPANLRVQLARAGWVRAVILNRAEEAQTLLSIWRNLDPAGAAVAAAYSNATQADSARTSAIFILLRNPGLTPLVESGFGRLTRTNRRDVFRDNWWCPGAQQPVPEPSNPAFLTHAQIERGSKESREIKEIAAVGAQYLARQTVAWAKAAPQDPRVPEELALAIQAVHYSPCSAGNAAQAAFVLLKKRYPDTIWARQTKYWYR